MPMTPAEQAAVDRMAATTPADFDGNGYEFAFPNRLNDAAIGIGAAGREIATTAASAAAAKTSQDAAKVSQDASKASETAAASSATAAGTARTGSEGARDAAVTARTGAESARDTAQGHRTAAGNSATAAAGSATAAGDAKSAAETARDASVGARTGAEAARDASVAARTGAETARDAAQAARDLATTRAAEAVAAQIAAKGSSDAAAALAAAFQIDPAARLVAPPTKDVRFLPDVTPAGVTVDRATVGFRTNRFGLLEPIAANGPRHDFDPITGAYLGVMVGPSRANVLTWSEDFSNSAWSKFRASVAVDAIRAPDGAMTADKLVESTETGSHSAVRVVLTPTQDANAISLYAKAGERSLFNIQATSGLVDPFNVSVNLLTGAIVGAASARVRLRKLPDGWWRISITFTPSAGTSSVQVSFATQIDANSVVYQGDGTSGLYLWGAQCEVGSAETSYIKTEGASVSRAADNISAPIASGIVNPAEATFFWEGIMGPSLGGNAEEALFSLDDGTLNNYLMVYRNNARRVGAVAVSQNPETGVVFSLALAAWGANPAPILNDHALARVALTTNRQVSRLAVNGASVEIPHRAGSVWTLSRLANLRLGHRVSTGTHMPGHQRRFLATPRFLTAAEIEALTRI